jgi:hypothetical protein
MEDWCEFIAHINTVVRLAVVLAGPPVPYSNVACAEEDDDEEADDDAFIMFHFFPQLTDYTKTI